MALSFTAKKRIRKSYGQLSETVLMPNLIEVQRSSYEQFLQMHTPVEKRDQDGLEAVFKSVFPIKDFSDRATLESYSNEISLLRRLAGHRHIIRLVEADFDAATRCLHVVMECGQTDLNRLLVRSRSEWRASARQRRRR